MSRVLAGRRPVLEALRAQTAVRRIFVENEDRFGDVLQAAKASGIRVTVRDRRDLDDLSGGVRHQGVVAFADPFVFHPLDVLSARLETAGILVALDEVTDPQNLGAIIRSAVALGVDGLLIPKHRAAGITPAVVRASAGATEHATIARVTNLQRALLTLYEAGMEIVGLDARGDSSIRDLAAPTRSRVLVVGSEGKGLRRMVRQRCEIVVQIPQPGPIDSLNASVAAAIAMYELTATHRKGEHER